VPRILLIAATTGYQTRAFAEAVRRAGFALTLATDRCHVLDDPWRDSAVAIRFDEFKASARVLESLPEKPDGIVAVADRSTTIAALAARGLGIAWHPPSAVALCRNKNLMRGAFQRAGLLCPEYFSVPLSSDAGEAAARADFPCVLKPLGLSASRGVIRANNAAEFVSAFERIRGILALPEILRFQDAADHFVQIEQYIPGREFALEGIMTRGALRMLALFDKPDPLEGPYFEETIYVTPSRACPAVQQAIAEACGRAAAALGLWQGPIHAEMRVNERGVYLLEIAARPIGGLCAKALRFAGAGERGHTLEDLIVRHAAGLSVGDLLPASPASGVMMIPTPGAGVLESVTGVEEALRTPLVTDVAITAKLGEKLVPLPEGASYPGFIFAEGADALSVERALREAHDRLGFRLLAALPTFGQAPG
jgi:D-alanine-D-alanine ligase-like ATP-grasp enzyme